MFDNVIDHGFMYRVTNTQKYKWNHSLFFNSSDDSLSLQNRRAFITFDRDNDDWPGTLNSAFNIIMSGGMHGAKGFFSGFSIIGYNQYFTYLFMYL